MPSYVVRVLFPNSRTPTAVPIADAADRGDAERQALERFPGAGATVESVTPWRGVVDDPEHFVIDVGYIDPTDRPDY